MHVVIYTDGACDPNPGPGGWAAILRYGEHEREISGSDPQTTNNRMELQAALEALKALKRPCRVILNTDSEYLRRGINEWLPAWQKRGWRTSGRKAVQNVDLWQALAHEVEQHEIEWRWVRGHAGHAKIDDPGPPFPVDEDVAGLEVAMDDAVLVGVLDGLADGCEQRQSMVAVKSAVAGVFRDRACLLDVLHGEERNGALRRGVGAGLKDLGDTGMLQSAEQLRLVLEAS